MIADWSFAREAETEAIKMELSKKLLSTSIDFTEEKYCHTKELIDEITLEVLAKYEVIDQEKIFEAMTVALQLHKDQKDRPDGQPYINHILEVAKNSLEISDCSDPDLLCAAFLHDSVEDQTKKICQSSAYEESSRDKALDWISAKFGPEVMRFVNGLSNPDFDKILAEENKTKSQPDYRHRKNQLYTEHIKEVIKDPKIFIVKMADFMNNAFRLDKIPADNPENQKRIKKLAQKYLPVYEIFIERLKNLRPEDCIREPEALTQTFENQNTVLESI